MIELKPINQKRESNRESIEIKEIWTGQGKFPCECPFCGSDETANNQYFTTLVGGDPDPNCVKHGVQDCSKCGGRFAFLHKLKRSGPNQHSTVCGYVVDGKLVKGRKECFCWPPEGV